ncbi:MAG: thiamine diphosphokinase [Balneolales bacterium]
MRILILANGSEPSTDLLKKLRSRCHVFIAADGGGNIAVRLGIPPDTVIGDLDSFYPDESYSGEVILDKNQETNDLEKALVLAHAKRADRVDILAATGKRLDHTLKNLSVLQQFFSTFDRIAMYDDYLYSCILPHDFSITLPEKHPVSLFPLSGKVDGIITDGLKYPLNNEFLENGQRDGSSNETLDGFIRIRHRSGTLLFMTALTDHLL